MEKLGRLESAWTATGVSQTLTYIKVKKPHYCRAVFIQQITALRKGHGEKVMHKEKAC